MVLVFLGSMTVTFLLSFVKAFQTKNFIGGHKLPAFITSWAITTCEISSVTFTVLGGWAMIIPAGIGGSVGVLVAMTFHDRIFKSKPHSEPHHDQEKPDHPDRRPAAGRHPDGAAPDA